MKRNIISSLIALSAIFIISSCSISNRSWKCRAFPSVATYIPKVEKSESIDIGSKKLHEDSIIIVSKPESHFSVSTRQPTSITNKKNIENAGNLKTVGKSKLISLNIVKKVVEFKKNLHENDKNENSGLKAVGWLVTIIGLLILLFASILIGILLMLLGLIFIISGRGGKSDEEKKSNNPQYIDVVYLKNGSVIKGIIIEQIPNEKLKIQTKDGSVFVYKMEEVAKIAKEVADSK